jgi:hypothetical protein
MAVALLSLLALPLSVFLFLWLFRVRSKKYLIGIPAVVLCIPMVLGVGIFLVRSPIQQGKFFADLGPTLSFLFPASDLYSPLVEKTLSPEMRDYNFDLSHKYVGNHVVSVEVVSDAPVNWDYEESLNVIIKVKNGDTVIFTDSANQGSPYRGKRRSGFSYVRYSVPGDIPVSKNLAMEVFFDKGLPQFLKKYKSANIIVRKTSDM